MKQISATAWIGLVIVLSIIVSVTWLKSQSYDDGIGRPSLAGADATAITSEDAPRPSSMVATSPLPPPSLTPEEMDAQRAADKAEVMKIVEAGRNKLKGQYEREHTDASWALAKAQTLERLSTSPQIEELEAKPTAIQAHCRSSVCRIEAHFKSRLAADDWFTLYTMNAGTEMPNVSLHKTNNPDGSMHLELYGFARP